MSSDPHNQARQRALHSLLNGDLSSRTSGFTVGPSTSPPPCPDQVLLSPHHDFLKSETVLGPLPWGCSNDEARPCTQSTERTVNTQLLFLSRFGKVTARAFLKVLSMRTNDTVK